YGKYAVGFNGVVLRAVDIVQGTAMDGGRYDTNATIRKREGKKADNQPPESPIGYRLALFGDLLINPPRKTSFCTGPSAAAFVAALTLILGGRPPQLSEEQKDAMRMQEGDVASGEYRRREDDVKFWGIWNGNDFGSYRALVDYSKMGKAVSP